jgi:TRAP-type mannitol/chloroaromatic compound transport system substrate-binding protein
VPERPPAVAEPGDAAFELSYWESIKNRDNPALFEAYLERYPNGRFAEIARLRIEAATASEDDETVSAARGTPSVELEPVETAFVAVKNANVREQPTVRAARVETIARGSEIHVTGKVKDRNWYLVEKDGRPLGYVFGDLLRPPDEARLALAPPPPHPTPTAAPEPAVGEFTRAPPAYDGPPVRWRMQTTFPKGFPLLGEQPERFADQLRRNSGGRIDIRTLGAGQVVAALEAFDAVRDGALDAGWSVPHYWMERDLGFAVVGGVPFGLDPAGHARWLMAGPGRRLMDDLYGRFGLKGLVCGIIGNQGDLWIDRPIRTARDFKGLRIRSPGLPGMAFEALGSTIVNLPGGEIPAAFQAGTIDGSGWLVPYNDLAFGLHKLAKYYYYPGVLEPATAMDMFVRLDTWNRLAPAARALIERACRDTIKHALGDYRSRDREALATLQNRHGVQVTAWPDSVLVALRRAWHQVAKRAASRSPSFRELYRSLLAYRR